MSGVSPGDPVVIKESGWRLKNTKGNYLISKAVPEGERPNITSIDLMAGKRVEVTPEISTSNAEAAEQAEEKI